VTLKDTHFAMAVVGRNEEREVFKKKRDRLMAFVNVVTINPERCE
jgi:hypothetical protein